MGKQLSKGERTRHTLIESAKQLFTEKGYHGTSMRDIARKANLALGGVYNHFKDKEELFDAVINTYHPLVRLPFLLKDIEGDNAEEILYTTALKLLSELDTNPAYINLLFIEAVEFQGRHMPSIIALVYPRIIALMQQIGATDKRLKSIPPALLFSTFMGNLTAFLLAKHLLMNSIGSEMGDLEDYLRVYLFGILNERE